MTGQAISEIALNSKGTYKRYIVTWQGINRTINMSSDDICRGCVVTGWGISEIARAVQIGEDINICKEYIVIGWWISEIITNRRGYLMHCDLVGNR